MSSNMLISVWYYCKCRTLDNGFYLNVNNQIYLDLVKKQEVIYITVV